MLLEVKLPDKPLGQHGLNTYYKEFTILFPDSKSKTYELGQFYTIRKPNDLEIVIAEFQLIWQNIKDKKKYASARLYFNTATEDSPQNQNFVEDEVIVADRQVVIECSKVPEWECPTESWCKGQKAYKHAPKWVSELYKNELSQEEHESNCKIKIISFPQYCRYMSCLQMIKMGFRMPYKSLLAKGGLTLSSLNTIVLFQRTTFKKYDIEDYSFTEGVRVPAFSGRPRKRKKAKTYATQQKKVKTEKFSRSYNTHHLGGKLPKRNAAIMATCALADAVEIIESNQQDTFAISPSEKHMENTNYKCNQQKQVDLNKEEKSKNEAEDDFDIKLSKFMNDRGTPLGKIPKLGYSTVNLHQLFEVVTDYGGYGQVTLKKLWRNVYTDLGDRHFSGITNAATCTRKIYERLLLPYEKHVFGDSKRKRKSLIVTRTPREKIKKSKSESPEKSNGPTFSFEKSDGSKLLIQKRRGRPSNEFRKQIAQFKKSSKTLKVEIFPPLNKSARVPTWMNDIVTETKPIKSPRQEEGKKEDLIIVTSKCSQITPEENTAIPFESNNSQKIGQELIPIRKPIDLIIASSDSQSKSSDNPPKSSDRLPKSPNNTSSSVSNSKLTISAASNTHPSPKSFKYCSNSQNNIYKQTNASFFKQKDSVFTTSNSVFRQKEGTEIPYRAHVSSRKLENKYERKQSPDFRNRVYFPSKYALSEHLSKSAASSGKGPRIKTTPEIPAFKTSTFTMHPSHYGRERLDQTLSLPMHHQNSHRETYQTVSHSPRKYVTGHLQTAITNQQLVPAEFVPLEHVRVEHLPINHHHVSSAKMKIDCRSIDATSDRLHKVIQLDHRLQARSNCATKIIEKPKILFSSDRVTPYVTKYPEASDKYILHEPRASSVCDNNSMYPILYTHVPHQYVSTVRHEPRMLIAEPLVRTNRVVYPSSIVSVNRKYDGNYSHTITDTQTDTHYQSVRKLDDSDIVIVPRNWR